MKGEKAMAQSDKETVFEQMIEALKAIEGQPPERKIYMEKQGLPMAMHGRDKYSQNCKKIARTVLEKAEPLL
jgi:hypothetical protein